MMATCPYCGTKVFVSSNSQCPSCREMVERSLSENPANRTTVRESPVKPRQRRGNIWVRLAGIALAVPSLWFLWLILVFPGTVTRGKGFYAPLVEFDPDLAVETIACMIGASCGVVLFIMGLHQRRSGSLKIETSMTSAESNN